MRVSSLVCAAVAAVIAIFVGLLASVDLSTPADHKAAEMGSGAMFDSIADACKCLHVSVKRRNRYRRGLTRDVLHS
jgi:hypothetical protein